MAASTRSPLIRACDVAEQGTTLRCCWRPRHRRAGERSERPARL